MPLGETQNKGYRGNRAGDAFIVREISSFFVFKL